MPDWLGRCLCHIGWHDYELIDASFGFAPAAEDRWNSVPPTEIKPRPEPGPPLPDWLGRCLCHIEIRTTTELIDASFGFAPRETVEHVRCRRCRRVTTRRGRR